MLASLLLLLLSNGLLSLAMGHLRGMHDTLWPQLIGNLVIFSMLVPLIYLITPEPPKLEWYMTAQSVALLCTWSLLTARILRPVPQAGI